MPTCSRRTLDHARRSVDTVAIDIHTVLTHVLINLKWELTVGEKLHCRLLLAFYEVYVVHCDTTMTEAELDVIDVNAGT